MEPRDTRGITLAIDIGGTFTDAVLEAGGRSHAAKVLTTSPDPDRGFLESAHQVLERASLAASDVGLIIHGTTLATNAIIERKGARVALICTEGPPTAFMVMSFHSGGAGARPTLDGLSATPFPSGVKNVPIEVTEAISPLVIWEKEYRQDSGGPGKLRGGLGQTMVVGNREGAEFAIFAAYDRVTHPPRGREGGASGMAGRVSLGAGAAMKGMGRQIIPAGDRVVMEMPGGGGYGNPAERDYGVVISAAGNIDGKAGPRDLDR
jgi:N-methylhydantoinase B/oxoprolinase/acetone carboxylase alpha subunit